MSLNYDFSTVLSLNGDLDWRRERGGGFPFTPPEGPESRQGDIKHEAAQK